MDKIIEYLKEKYEPISIIVYGSYADGTNNANSDFDALVISKQHESFHDISVVGGILLDVFVYPENYFQDNVSYADFLQISDGIVIWDTNGFGKNLKSKVVGFIDSLPRKSDNEIQNDIEWCKKMVLRIKRGDAEGAYRGHWVLVDSLEIFCEVMHHTYNGPKKSLLWMKKECPEAFLYYLDALKSFTLDATEKWIQYLETAFLSRKHNLKS